MSVSLSLVNNKTFLEFLPDDVESAQAYAAERELNVRWSSYRQVRRGHAMVCRAEVVRSRTECPVLRRLTLEWDAHPSRCSTMPGTPAAKRGVK